jgi:hypothetical protein
MKEKDFERYVDEYYTHKENASEPEINDENTLLYSSLDTMDALEKINFNIDLDIMSIIDQGEEISIRKKDTKEFILFLLSAFLLIGVVVFACIYINKNIFVYIQLIIVIFLPFILIPLSYYRTTKGGLQ